MRKITINLLGNSKLLRKQKRIKFFLSSAYIFLWLFSIFTIVHIYRTNLFISSVYIKEIQKINTEVTQLGPKFERIRLLNRRLSHLKKQHDDYQQLINRPDLWSSKMLSLSALTPNHIRLNKLQVRTPLSNKKNKEYLHFTGIARINSKTPDNDQLNQFKKSLEKDKNFMAMLDKIKILETRIENHNDKPVMSFAMSVY